jgi:preprotein translocase subunit SecF
MDFAGKWKVWFAISLMVIGAGLVSLFVNGGLNLSIDFTGGNLLEVQFSESVSSSEVRDVLRKFDLEKSPVQSSGDNRYIIRTGTLSEEKSTEILDTMEKDLGSIDVLRNEKVDAIIGGELTRDGIIALVLASLLIVAYITWRFEFNFAVAGIIALLHDVMVMTSFMAIFRLEVDITFIAAVLTIIGYSINDTIVVFDRIRENIHSRKYKELAALVNDSIMQTLRRTIFTTASTLLVLLALIFLGGDTTRIFATALTVGCISGSYSTIFIASPIWMLMKQRRSPQRHLKAEKAG